MNDRQKLIEILTAAGIFVEEWQEWAGVAFSILDSDGNRIIFMFTPLGHLVGVEVG